MAAVLKLSDGLIFRVGNKYCSGLKQTFSGKKLINWALTEKSQPL
jgi:hypothetical protein